MARIAVTPAEEDEVIIAGASSNIEPDNRASSEASGFVEPVRETAGADSFEAGEASVPSDSLAASKEPASAKSEETVAQARPANREKPNRADDYHETTLEDLESGGMPFAQRVVIVAAVVCIIGALVYYFVAMR